MIKQIRKCPICQDDLIIFSKGNFTNFHCEKSDCFFISYDNERLFYLRYNIGDIEFLADHDTTELYKGLFPMDPILIVSIKQLIFPESFEYYDLKNLIDRLSNLGVYS